MLELYYCNYKLLIIILCIFWCCLTECAINWIKCCTMRRIYTNFKKTNCNVSFYVYGFVHRNLYYNKPTRCSCSQSILFPYRVSSNLATLEEGGYNVTTLM